MKGFSHTVKVPRSTLQRPVIVSFTLFTYIHTLMSCCRHGRRYQPLWEQGGVSCPKTRDWVGDGFKLPTLWQMDNRLYHMSNNCPIFIFTVNRPADKAFLVLTACPYVACNSWTANTLKLNRMKGLGRVSGVVVLAVTYWDRRWFNVMCCLAHFCYGSEFLQGTRTCCCICAWFVFPQLDAVSGNQDSHVVIKHKMFHLMWP